jgi:hypothetical protein
VNRTQSVSITSGSTDVSLVVVLPAGSAADGVRLVDGGVKALDDPRYADGGFAALFSAALDGTVSRLERCGALP